MEHITHTKRIRHLMWAISFVFVCVVAFGCFSFGYATPNTNTKSSTTTASEVSDASRANNGSAKSKERAASSSNDAATATDAANDADAAKEAEADSKTSAATSMAQSVLAHAAANALYPSVDQGFQKWFSAHSCARVIDVVVVPRDPISFGPWYAVKDYGAADAREDGSVTEWSENYYITHSWSDYGNQILGMNPGDSVTINDRAIVVEGVFNYPKESFLEEVREVCGQDAIVIQTCYPDSDENRIVYGR